MSFEDRIRETIKSKEAQLFDIRSELIKYFQVCDGGHLTPDPRYKDKISEMQQQDKALTQSITRHELALSRAAEIGRSVRGCDVSNPQTWLTARANALHKEIGSCKADISILKQRIEGQKLIAPQFEVSDGHGNIIKRKPDPAAEWQAQIKTYEARIQEMQPEYDKVMKAYHEVEKILQNAA